MSKKTLTTYEALKANETKRVRITGGQGEWHKVGGLIDLLNRGYLGHRSFMEWEAEEPLVERWVLIAGLMDISIHSSEDTAKIHRDTYYPKASIVHLREVRS